jgi:hypothetical protein
VLSKEGVHSPLVCFPSINLFLGIFADFYFCELACGMSFASCFITENTRSYPSLCRPGRRRKETAVKHLWERGMRWWRACRPCLTNNQRDAQNTIKRPNRLDTHLSISRSSHLHPFGCQVHVYVVARIFVYLAGGQHVRRYGFYGRQRAVVTPTLFEICFNRLLE